MLVVSFIDESPGALNSEQNEGSFSENPLENIRATIGDISNPALSPSMYDIDITTNFETDSPKWSAPKDFIHSLPKKRGKN